MYGTDAWRPRLFTLRLCLQGELGLLVGWDSLIGKARARQAKDPGSTPGPDNPDGRLFFSPIIRKRHVNALSVKCFQKVRTVKVG